jgi:predicted ATPase/class 3 adenylate cyclase
MAMPALPSGFVTFMFTDIEGSTRLHQKLSDRFVALIAEHDGLLSEAVATHGGVVLKSMGDGLFAVFDDVSRAVLAAAHIQQIVAEHPWPDLVDVRVRIGLHAGDAQPQGHDYVALPVHQAARVCAAAHGGQVVITDDVSRHLGIDIEKLDLGEHRLKDFPQPVALWQLGSTQFPPLRTISATNLPRPVSAFVGRADEVAQVVELIKDRSRLVTLTGPGGSGKTRLAIEAATELVGHFKAGVLWVDLKQLRDATQVMATIAATLGSQTGLEEHIADRDLLMLLDNIEQVISVAPALVSLIEGCPNLRLLLTSRERLQVRGEVGFSVAPLAESDAVTLFCERSGVRPSEDVRRLCLALDRLPLGIELAAARARVLTAGQILDRLGSRLDSLKGGRDVDPRQRTLRATIAWSFELLDEDERRLFSRLAVFAGGCTLEAAEEIVDADIDLLQSLVDKSLLEYSAGRFTYLGTIREFALERLKESGEQQQIASRHSAWFVDHVRTAQVYLHTADQQAWLEQLYAETDNIRAVLDRSLDEPTPSAFELANALISPWRGRGHLAELVAWYGSALAELEHLDAHTRAATIESYGVGLMFCNSPLHARDRLEESLALYRELGDEKGEASALNSLGSTCWILGDAERALDVRHRALEIYRRLGDHKGVGRSLHLIGEDLRDAGNFAGAEKMLDDSIAIDLQLGDEHGVMMSMHSLGDLWLDAHEAGRARDRYRAALAIAYRLGDELSEAYCVAGLACVAVVERNLLTAGWLWSAAESIERGLGETMLAIERERYEGVVAPFAGDELFKAAAEDAANTPTEQIIQRLLRE